jgi:hypothetical protein
MGAAEQYVGSQTVLNQPLYRIQGGPCLAKQLKTDPLANDLITPGEGDRDSLEHALVYCVL